MIGNETKENFYGAAKPDWVNFVPFWIWNPNSLGSGKP
jgi:hypothetical protein